MLCLLVNEDKSIKQEVTDSVPGRSQPCWQGTHSGQQLGQQQRKAGTPEQGVQTSAHQTIILMLESGPTGGGVKKEYSAEKVPLFRSCSANTFIKINGPLSLSNPNLSALSSKEHLA